MAKAFKTLNLSKRLNKVFIIPNNLGMYFIGVWATCFLLSVGYASNLLLFMAILQFALFFWWMITAHADTGHLQVKHIAMSAGHAETSISLLCAWNNPDYSSQIRVLTLIGDKDTRYPVELSHPFSVAFDKRGKYHFHTLEIGLTTGFWLFKTWKYVAIDLTTIVYPKPLPPAFDIQQTISLKDETQEYKQQHTQAVELDLQRDADEKTRSTRINWKRFAQRGQLIERFGESGLQLQKTFDFDSMKSELEVSYMTYEILQFYEQGQSWFIKNKSELFGPYNTSGKNKDELHQCLSLLATYTW